MMNKTRVWNFNINNILSSARRIQKKKGKICSVLAFQNKFFFTASILVDTNYFHGVDFALQLIRTKNYRYFKLLHFRKKE